MKKITTIFFAIFLCVSPVFVAKATLGIYKRMDNSDRIYFQADMKRLFGKMDEFIALPLFVQGSIFNHISLDGAVFDDCDFNSTLFHGGSARRTSFMNTSFENSVFEGTILRDVIFGETTGKEAADLKRSQFKNADLTNARFARVKGEALSFTYSTLTNAIFDNAQVIFATFTDCDLSNTSFKKACLRISNFTNSTLLGADFKGADLTEAYTFVKNEEGRFVKQMLTPVYLTAQGAVFNKKTIFSPVVQAR